MTGLEFELKAGENVISITVADGIKKSQHFRDLYLAFDRCVEHDYGNRFDKQWGVCQVCGYVEDNHEHVVSWGYCLYCDYEYEAYEVPSTFDNDGDGVADVFYFSAALPEEFQGEDVIWLDAFNDSTGSHMEYDEIRAGSGKLPYPHVYNSDGNTSNSITFTFTVEKAGIYKVAVHYRIKDAQTRGATFVVNGEQKIPHTYGWASNDEAYECRNNDFLIGAYMTGLQIELKKGENVISITVADGVKKSQHFRDLYLVLVEEYETPEVEEPAAPEAPETLTVDDILAIGLDETKVTWYKGTGNAPADTWSADYYVVTITANSGSVNQETGFFRSLTSDGVTKIAVAAITLGEGQTMPQEGDTVVIRARIGRIAGGEVRLYDATIVG